MMKSPPVFSFVGHSGAGKTSFLEKLITTLCGRGIAVAAIKHAHHKVELDHEGKDSWRYTQAGACMSLLQTTNALQLIAREGAGRSPRELAERFLGGVDIVLAEGFAQAEGQKIEILRRACNKPPRCTPEDGLIALVSDMPEIYPELPHFALDDVAGVADFILCSTTAAH